LDHEERKRKKEAREVHRRAEFARKAIGIKGKMFAKKRHAEKAQMKKTIAMHEEKDSKKKAEDGAPQNALPAYLLERDQVGQVASCYTAVESARALQVQLAGQGSP
jgi:ribosome biogenesis protein NSA2